jgi:pimeloyl-ACP methyl ester carboxylesterase
MTELCPLILLHGGLADHRACAPFAGPLSARFRVLTPDLLGAGAARHAGPLTWDLIADHVAAEARALGVTRAVVGGISFGAGAAVRVALRHPALVHALILLTPAYGGADLGFNAAQTAAMDAMAGAGLRALTDGIAALHPLFAALPPAIQDRARAMVDSFDPASVAATTAFMASGAQPFATGADLAAITAPTLLVPGTDPTHPPEVAAVYRRHLPRCTVRDVVPADFTADYATPIAAFLTGVRAAPSPP